MARILVTTFNKPGYNMGEAALFLEWGLKQGFFTSDRTTELWKAIPPALIDDLKRGGIQKVEVYPTVKLFGLMSLSAGSGLGWSRIVRDHVLAFRSWLTSLYSEPIGCWVVGGHSSDNATYKPMNWGTEVSSAADWRPYAGIGLERKSLQLEWFGYKTANDVPRDIQLPEARTGLKSVSLMLILGCNGAWYAKPWQDYIVASGGKAPLVLGWHGTHYMPQDGLKQHASQLFWEKIGPKPAGSTLDDLCRDESDRVVQAWGLACWQAFHDAANKGGKTDQRHLWYRGKQKCAAAVLPDGSAFVADPSFNNDPGQKPMKAYAP